eukprot:3913119-Rhodomonas_salina.2
MRRSIAYVSTGHHYWTLRIESIGGAVSQYQVSRRASVGGVACQYWTWRRIIGSSLRMSVSDMSYPQRMSVPDIPYPQLNIVPQPAGASTVGAK